MPTTNLKPPTGDKAQQVLLQVQVCVFLWGKSISHHWVRCFAPAAQPCSVCMDPALVVAGTLLVTVRSFVFRQAPLGLCGPARLPGSRLAVPLPLHSLHLVTVVSCVRSASLNAAVAAPKCHCVVRRSAAAHPTPCAPLAVIYLRVSNLPSAAGVVSTPDLHVCRRATAVVTGAALWLPVPKHHVRATLKACHRAATAPFPPLTRVRAVQLSSLLNCRLPPPLRCP